MAFRKKWEFIKSLKPDLLILQECENESKYKSSEIIPDYNQFIWVGDNLNKGVGVVSFNNYQIELSNKQTDDFKYIIPINVRGNFNFCLYAIWSLHVKQSTKESYIGQIWKAVNHFKEDLPKPSILIGDWNSNAMWNSQRKIGNHSNVVDFLKSFKIKSVYHHLRNEKHGEELEPTLYLLKNVEKPYHIDYCFASDVFFNEQIKMEVGLKEKWLKHSDHMPIMIEF